MLQVLIATVIVNLSLVGNYYLTEQRKFDEMMYYSVGEKVKGEYYAVIAFDEARKGRPISIIWKNLYVHLYRIESNLGRTKDGKLSVTVIIPDEEYKPLPLVGGTRMAINFESDTVYLYQIFHYRTFKVLYEGVISGRWRTQKEIEDAQKMFGDVLEKKGCPLKFGVINR